MKKRNQNKLLCGEKSVALGGLNPAAALRAPLALLCNHCSAAHPMSDPIIPLPKARFQSCLNSVFVEQTETLFSRSLVKTLSGNNSQLPISILSKNREEVIELRLF